LLAVFIKKPQDVAQSSLELHPERPAKFSSRKIWQKNNRWIKSGGYFFEKPLRARLQLPPTQRDNRKRDCRITQTAA
jgi:hypothetical protein